MTVRLRASVIPGLLALTALSLTACASQGTIGAGADGGTVPGTGGSPSPGANGSATGSSAPSSASTGSSAPNTPATGPTPGGSGSQDPSALASSFKTLTKLWTDQGCKTALAGFSDYVTAEEQGEVRGVAAIPGAQQKIRAGAQQTKLPQAAQAMTKMAADMQAMFDQAKQGQTPDKGPVGTDFQIMGNVCSQP